MSAPSDLGDPNGGVDVVAILFNVIVILILAVSLVAVWLY